MKQNHTGGVISPHDGPDRPVFYLEIEITTGSNT